MWIMTKFGFYSIVKHARIKNIWMLRARKRQDLENLLSVASLTCQIIETPINDYRFRVFLSPKSKERISEILFDSIDYDNFKSEIGTIPDQAPKLNAYYDIWEIMRKQARDEGDIRAYVDNTLFGRSEVLAGEE